MAIENTGYPTYEDGVRFRLSDLKDLLYVSAMSIISPLYYLSKRNNSEIKTMMFSNLSEDDLIRAKVNCVTEVLLANHGFSNTSENSPTAKAVMKFKDLLAVTLQMTESGDLSEQGRDLLFHRLVDGLRSDMGMKIGFVDKALLGIKAHDLLEVDGALGFLKEVKGVSQASVIKNIFENFKIQTLPLLSAQKALVHSWDSVHDFSTGDFSMFKIKPLPKPVSISVLKCVPTEARNIQRKLNSGGRH